MSKKIKGDEHSCPYCKSKDLSWGVFELEDHGGHYLVTCNKCNKEWEQFYKIIFQNNYSIN